ncbi:MAG: glycosyltransferase family 1 protein [Burkholderiales bacterium]
MNRQAARHSSCRLLIDCTETTRVRAFTGIQRTVRSLLDAGGAVDEAAFVPVRFDGARFRTADAPTGLPASVSVRERMRRLVLHGSRSPLLRATVFHPRVQSGLRRGLAAGYWSVRRAGAGLGAQEAFVEYRGSDWLVLLDSTWGPDLRPEIERARRAGARVCVVVYDLIQLHHPELVSPGAAEVFSRWLARTLPLADRILTISAAVRAEVEDHLRKQGLETLVGRLDWFHLGCDLPAATAASPSPDVEALFAGSDAPTYLAVGTLEPRKSQETLVDAFESLWRRGDPSRLVLFGKEGWGSHGLVDRIARHPERNRRLVWKSDGTDADLRLCYAKATAVLNASLCEGFGLPIVEAASFGAPVVASDIPVFREVAGTDVAFVKPGDVDAWARAIASKRVRTQAMPARLPTWKESASTLAVKLCACT